MREAKDIYEERRVRFAVSGNKFIVHGALMLVLILGAQGTYCVVTSPDIWLFFLGILLNVQERASREVLEGG